MNPRIWLPATFVFLLNVFLNWPIALPGVAPYRGSIERGYAYMAWIFSRNPDYLSWNPIQYCGIPMHYVYLPLLPYIEAILLWLIPDSNPTYLHRALCACALFVTPAAVYILIRLWTRQAQWALYSALAITLYSPLYWMITTIDRDRGIMQVPWRVQVLIKYGEGPHTVGILLLIVALIAVRHAAGSTGFAAIAGGACALTTTVLTNWVAGLALAFAVTMLLVAHVDDPKFRHRRVFAAGLLGYLLSAFWLTPDFIAQMALNWPKDAFGYQFQRWEQLAMIAWFLGLVILRLIFWRWGQERHLCWLTLCTVGYGLPVILFYRYGINAFPEARRYALEFEMFLLLLAVEVFRQLFSSRYVWIRRLTAAAALASLLAITPQISRFVSHRYARWVLTDAEDSAEYRVAMALRDLNPQGRVFVTGGSRFRLNSWVLIPQTGGVFETGLKTRFPVEAGYQITTDLGFAKGKEFEQSMLLLRAMAVEYVVVHGPESEEFYKDFKNPTKFDGKLEKVWSAAGDSIYRITPFRYAHLLHPSEVPAMHVLYGHQAPWYPYIAGQLDAARPVLAFQWINARQAFVSGTMEAGMQVAFAIPYDPNWRAYVGGTRVELRKSTTGLMISAPLAARSTAMELRFEPSMQELGGIGISLGTALACGIALIRRKRK